MGREASILLARGGHTVYAGARRANRMDDLSEHGITPVEMDVSKGEDNERAVRRRRYVKGAFARPLKRHPPKEIRA